MCTRLLDFEQLVVMLLLLAKSGIRRLLYLQRAYPDDRYGLTLDAACGPADCSLQIAIFRATRIVSNATVDGIRY